MAGTVDEAAERGAAFALSRGERALACEILMQAYATRLLRYCLRKLDDGDVAQAEDLVQIIFAEAWRALRRWEGRSSFRTWLFRIARNRCVDALRSRIGGIRGRTGRLDTDAELRCVEPNPGAASASIGRRGLDAALAQCLEALPEPTREAYLLRFWQEMSYEDIAAVAGEAPDALRKRITRAFVALRECLGAKGVGSADVL